MDFETTNIRMLPTIVNLGTPALPFEKLDTMYDSKLYLGSTDSLWQPYKKYEIYPINTFYSFEGLATSTFSLGTSIMTNNNN